MKPKGNSPQDPHSRGCKILIERVLCSINLLDICRSGCPVSDAALSRSKQSTVVADEVRRLRSAACSRKNHPSRDSWVHIHCCGNGHLGFRPYAVPLGKLAPTGPLESITYFVFDRSCRPVYDAALSRSKQATKYLQHPPISSLSLRERARVRGALRSRSKDREASSLLQFYRAYP